MSRTSGATYSEELARERVGVLGVFLGGAMVKDSDSANGTSWYLFRYEDILRAIGRYVDTKGIQDVVLLQLEEGILLRGLQPSGDRGGKQLIEQFFTSKELVEHVFTADDLKRIDEAAKKERGKGSSLFR